MASINLQPIFMINDFKHTRIKIRLFLLNTHNHIYLLFLFSLHYKYADLSFIFSISYYPIG